MTGCASTVTFKAVDAVTNQPLAGVNTVWRMDSIDFLYITRHHFGPTNLPPSTENGVVVVNGPHKYAASRFIFSRDGYAPVYGIYYNDSMACAEHIYPALIGGFNITAPVSYVSPTNGVIVVRMSPQ